MCVCVRERDDVYKKQEKLQQQEARMNQQLQREGEGAYVVTFSLSSLTSTASWERGGVLTTY